jgi:hypothetical protein
MLAAGADAFLCGCGAIVIAFFEAEKYVLELIHPGIREKQGRIAMRDKRRAAHAAVAFALKELQKFFANLVPRHLTLISRCKLIF